MAEPAYKVNIRRGKESSYWQGRGNGLIAAATPTDQRNATPRVDKDPHRNVSNMGRIELMNAGRTLYSNNPVVRGAINEAASLSSAVFIPQFAGDDSGYGDKAEAWLREHDKICDVAGWNYDFQQYRWNLVVAALRDGDVGTLLIENDDGYPQLQVVPAHRIGSSFLGVGNGASGITYAGGIEKVLGGQYDGYTITDGVICDDYGRPIAYRIQDEGSEDGFRDVSADSMWLSFFPEYSGQVRGFSQLASSSNVWTDINESTALRMARAKLAASQGIIESNETGDTDSSRKLLGSSSGTYNTDGAATDLPTSAALSYRTERVDGLINRYFKTGTGSKLEFLDNNNPSQNEQEFEAEQIRRALQGIGWSYDFSLNPTGMGGQNGRVVVLKINRRIKQIQDAIIRPSVRRFDGYRLSKAAKKGLIPQSAEWWKWEYQAAAQITSDEGYSSQVALNEMKAGVSTARQVCGERGRNFDDVRNAKQKEAVDLLTRASALASQFGIPLQQAITLLSDTSTYSSFTNASAAQADPTLTPP